MFYYPGRQALKKTTFLRFKSAHFNELKRVCYMENLFNTFKCALLKRKNVVFLNAWLTGKCSNEIQMNLETVKNFWIKKKINFLIRKILLFIFQKFQWKSNQVLIFNQRFSDKINDEINFNQRKFWLWIFDLEISEKNCLIDFSFKMFWVKNFI